MNSSAKFGTFSIAFRGMDIELRRFLSEMKGRGKVTLLDVGCGSGSLRHAVDGFEYFGCDIITQEVKFPYKQITKLNRLPYKDNSFDVLIMNWVMEYVENKSQFFDEILRILKPGGSFFIVTNGKLTPLVNLPINIAKLAYNKKNNSSVAKLGQYVDYSFFSKHASNQSFLIVKSGKTCGLLASIFKFFHILYRLFMKIWHRNMTILPKPEYVTNLPKPTYFSYFMVSIFDIILGYEGKRSFLFEYFVQGKKNEN